MDQKKALEILKSGENVFLTGPPGSGKTYTLKKYISYKKKLGGRVGITASTGIAATHLDGRTIHSWSGLGIKKELNKEDIEKIVRKPHVRDRVLNADTLVVDEISMLDPKQFSLVDIILKRIRNNGKPFGDIQIVLSGDFFQLPPIRKNEEELKFVTDTNTWEILDPKICYLNDQYRQKDKKLIKVLKDIRERRVNENTIKLLEDRLNKDLSSKIKPTRLYTHNKNVDTINSWELDKIDEKSYYYEMKEKGEKPLIKSIKKSCLAPERLHLKKHAKVMFLKNNFNKGYVNGTLGEIKGFKNTGVPIVETTDGKKIEAEPEVWLLEEEGDIKAEIRQIPLRLAWAITVHKSQGMTLDMAEIDLGNAFEEGMGYVALSRVKSLDGIKLKSFNKTSLKVSEKAAELDKEFKRKSE